MSLSWVITLTIISVSIIIVLAYMTTQWETLESVPCSHDMEVVDTTTFYIFDGHEGTVSHYEHTLQCTLCGVTKTL